MSLLWKDAEVGQGEAWPLGAGPQSSCPHWDGVAGTSETGSTELVSSEQKGFLCVRDLQAG